MQKKTEKLFDVWIRLKPYIKAPDKVSNTSKTTKNGKFQKFSKFPSTAKKHQRFRSQNSNLTHTPPRTSLANTDSTPSKRDYQAISIGENKKLVISQPSQGKKEKQSFLKRKGETQREIAFPKVFSELSSTKKIYQEVLDSRVDKSFDGLSFTLITYGISGSGKTHTTFGSEKPAFSASSGLVAGGWEDGLLFYTAKKVFKCRDGIKKFQQLKIKANFIEIYNENVYDLMGKNSEKKLKLAECALTQGVLVQNLTTVDVDNIGQLKHLLEVAQEKRVVSSNVNNL
jgi:hypothetical protein